MSTAEWLNETISFADVSREFDARSKTIRDTARTYGRLGCVVAVSGGVDSGTVLALATSAFGSRRVVALALPDRDTDPQSTELAGAGAAGDGVADFSIRGVHRARE